MSNPVERRRGLRTTILFPGKSIPLTLLMCFMFAYSVLPLFWLFVNATKSNAEFVSTSGLWFGSEFALWDNIVKTVTYEDGVFVRWFGNTVLYTVFGAGGATLIATLAGYGLSHFRFPGRRLVVAIVIGAIAIPGSALAVPTFLLFSQLGLTNNPLGVIIPTMLNPFGLFLIWSYANSAVPAELMEAARVDGAGELRIFLQVSFRLLAPGIVTVLLFSFVSSWNNYFLPLIMLNRADLLPLPVGLASWNTRNQSAGLAPIYDLILTGSLLTLIPIFLMFFVMQRYWQSGLAAGGVKA